MEIFFINSENFKLKDTQNFSTKFSSEKRKTQHILGRFLVKYAAKNYYKISDTEIEIKNNKPQFIQNSINFSITHSKNIVMAVFDKNPVGIDVEYMKPRDFEKIFKHYNIEIKNPSKETFYRFWTEYEAQIKLQQTVKSSFSAEFPQGFIMSAASNQSLDIKKMLKIYEVKSPIKSTKPIELISLNPVSESSINENTLVIQDINTASLTCFEPLNLKIE